jgi:hypothetical protein
MRCEARPRNEPVQWPVEERVGIEDVRVCELAVEISEAQRREILEMDWLIDDIERSGVAATAEEARNRAPDYEEPAERQCPG